MNDLTPHPVAARLAEQDWLRIAAGLDADGYAVIGPLLTETDCATLSAGFDADTAFRNRVVMAHHGYGAGEYRYYAYPLPELIVTLRTGLYARLAPIANRWQSALGRPAVFPANHAAYLEQCHAAGQTRPTPLLLRYQTGDYNRLHQDLYGELCFPLQAAFLLDRPGDDFQGGEFLLTEQRPRMQTRAEVVPLKRGEGVIFAVNQRPAASPRGVSGVTMRHGVSRVRSGHRHTLGIIFHDAK
nr:2OG-Fe(II) oxygenase [uncultured Rhodopila sp.]